MVAVVSTVAYLGFEARNVEVQVQLSAGLPHFVIVGLPDKAVAESFERIRSSLGAIGLALPPKRITVELSHLEGLDCASHLDLPIALGILTSIGAVDAETLSHFCVIGKLSFDGALLPVRGVLTAALFAASQNMGLVCPEEQGAEAAWAGNLEVVGAPNLLSLLLHLRGARLLKAPQPGLPGNFWDRIDDDLIDFERGIVREATAKYYGKNDC